MRSQKVAFLGIFTALAMILSYIETLIPSFVAIPGIKLGLANIAVIVILYKIGWKEAFAVSIIRVILSSLLFTTVLSMLYSLAGAILSLFAMILLKKIKLSTITISVIGGVCHNIGQIAVAIFMTETAELVYYLPVLLITGTISGILIGLVGAITVKKMEKLEF
jgi:heptaprenyl diphosphate synthase